MNGALRGKTNAEPVWFYVVSELRFLLGGLRVFVHDVRMEKNKDQ